MPATHVLKCESRFFQAVKRGDKNFEVRRDDRGYQTGDTIELVEIPNSGSPQAPATMPPSPLPEAIKREISYVLHGGDFGIDHGFVVLGLRNG